VVYLQNTPKARSAGFSFQCNCFKTSK